MKNKILALILALAYINSAQALTITEIQFDPSGTDTDREWVEVWNESGAAIDFSKYKFFEAGVNHTLTAVSGATLEAGEYGVVIQDSAKFFADYPNFTGKVFTSSFSLSNTGEALSFKNAAGTTVDSRTYTPSSTGAGNGLSEQFTEGIWTKGGPSPGAANVKAIIDNNATTTATTTATSTSTTSTSTVQIVTATVTEIVEVPKIVYIQKSYWPATEKVYVNAGSNILTVVGAEVEFKAQVYDPESKRQLSTGDFHWSFGDGNEFNGSKNAKHVYKFPGEYTAIFNASSEGRFEEDRLYVKVVKPEIGLKVGSDNNLKYIEITNNYNEELKLEGFLLTQMDNSEIIQKRFPIPKGFSILPKRSIKIDWDLTKFTSPTSFIGLNFASDIQLARVNIPDNFNNLSISTATTSPSFVIVQTPEQAAVSAFATTTPIATTTYKTKAKIRKVITNNSINNVATNLAATATTTATSSKIIISKPEKTFWQKTKSFLGI